MKLHLLKRVGHKDKSFNVRLDQYPHFLKVWHHHTALELVVIKKSTGTLFIGDAIEDFKPGDVVLIGKNLPHMWLNDESYFAEDSDLTAEAIAIHFKEDFLGASFFESTALNQIKKMLDKTQLGIKFRHVSDQIYFRFENLLNQTGFDRLINFLQILQDLSDTDCETLVSSGFTSTFSATNDMVLDSTYDFIYKNFNRPISASDVAEAIHMNASAFSRYFKKIHHKTFTCYLNELRIGYACKLLLENKLSITAICYDCGYNNVSNFNRQFKKIKGMSPSGFVKKHR